MYDEFRICSFVFPNANDNTIQGLFQKLYEPMKKPKRPPQENA